MHINKSNPAGNMEWTTKYQLNFSNLDKIYSLRDDSHRFESVVSQ